MRDQGYRIEEGADVESIIVYREGRLATIPGTDVPRTPVAKACAEQLGGDVNRGRGHPRVLGGIARFPWTVNEPMKGERRSTVAEATPRFVLSSGRGERFSGNRRERIPV